MNECEETCMDDEKTFVVMRPFLPLKRNSATSRMWRFSQARYRKLAHDASKSRWHCFGSRGHRSVRSMRRTCLFLLLSLLLLFLSLASSSGRSSITTWSGRRRGIAASRNPFLRNLRRRLCLLNGLVVLNIQSL